jgi:hypothetical protein
MGNILFGCSEAVEDTTKAVEGTTKSVEGTNNFSELQAKLSKRGIVPLCEYTLLLISIIIDAYDENGFCKFYEDEDNTTKKETIEELDKELLENIIYINNVVTLITNLINFTSKKDKIKCWDLFEKKTK